MTLPAHQARQRLASGDFDPFAHRCACGAPQHQHGGAKNTGANAATGCRRYRPDPIDELVHKALNAAGSTFLQDVAAWQERSYPRPQPRPGGWSVGPSDVDTCPKAIQLREKPPEGFVPEPENDAVTVIGSMYHHAARIARQALYPWRMFEQAVTIPGLDRQGRYDVYDPVLAEVGDIKTAGLWKWDQIGKYGPTHEHWEQLAIYGYALRAAGYPVEWLRLEYINREGGFDKSDQDDPEHGTPMLARDEQFRIPYSEALARKALGKLRAYLVALDTGQDLPRDPRRSGPSSDPICARCPFRRACWNMDAAEAAGRSPESYTILGPDPLYEDVEWAARQVATYAEDKKDAKTQWKTSRNLLEGIKPGAYGEFTIVSRKRTMPDWKAWATKVRDARQRYQGMDPARRGDFADWVADLTVPDRIDTWVEVKRTKRAADRPADREATAA